MFEYGKSEDEVSEKDRQRKRKREGEITWGVSGGYEPGKLQTDILWYQQQTDNSIKSTKENA